MASVAQLVGITLYNESACSIHSRGCAEGSGGMPGFRIDVFFFISLFLKLNLKSLIKYNEIG